MGATAPPAPWDVALAFLTPRRRFEREVEVHLRKKDVSEGDVRSTMVRLRELGLVSDSDTCRAWIADRLNFSPRGRAKLRIELLRQGVEEVVVESALEELVSEEAELEAACRVLRKKAPGALRLGESVARRRMWGALSRRGFSSHVAGQAVAQVLTEGLDPGFDSDPEETFESMFEEDE